MLRPVRNPQREFIVKTNRIASPLAPALAAVALCLATPFLSAQNSFLERDLVSDISGRALVTDPHLVNPWGLVAGPTTPWWVSDAGSGVSTLYTGAGVPQALVVTVPGPGGSAGSPTGQVFNGGTAFSGDRFIFATEEGTIDGWRGALGTMAEVLLDHSPQEAVYKGLALGTVGPNSYLYATDFHNARIDVLGSLGAPALAGSFADPTIPAGYAPFNIQNIGGQLYVTYAKQDADAHDDVAGPGNGYLNVFDLNGNFIRRLTSGGHLNSPWGLAMAPIGFGNLGGDLLVGNFGDGMINAYNPVTGAFIDSLRQGNGDPLQIEGLWGLAFGNGGAAGPTTTLFFTAGIAGPDAIEDHGLFGSISAVPEPSTYFAGIALIGFCGLTWLRRRKLVAV